MSKSSPAIVVNNVSFSYGNEVVLHDVSFDVAPQSLCALVGPNGSGKSTLIRCITGLSSPTTGSVSLHHEGTTTIRVGYVEQRHFISNDFPINAYEVVSSGLAVSHKRWWKFSDHDKEKIDHALDSVGLLDHKHCAMTELSGGQQQRVLIAKAFVSDPDILILDEPVAGVDSASQKLFRDALEHTIDEHHTTVLLVSHELSAVSDIVDQVVVMKNTVLFDGTPDQLSSDGVSLGVHSHDLPVWLEHLDGPTKGQA